MLILGKYELTDKAPGRYFNDAVLGKIDVENINEFTAEKLVKKGFLRKVAESPESNEPQPVKKKKS